VYNGDKTPVQKLTHFTVSKNLGANKIPVGTTWECRAQLFGRGGAIAPMESASMIGNCIGPRPTLWIRQVTR